MSTHWRPAICATTLSTSTTHRFLPSSLCALSPLFGAHSSPARSLTYWHRPHTSKTRLPILFIHGIGVGLYPYIDFLAELNANDGEDLSDGQMGIIALEIMPVSSRITGEAMSQDKIGDEVHRILKEHKWEKFVLVSHS